MSKSRKIKLEDYRLGYPRLAAFLNVDKNFSILKRFDNLNLRVLLEKQDRLAQLEEQLNKCDDDEALQLHLGSRRQDENSRRRELMGYIETELEAYGAAVLRYQQLTSIPAARKSRRESVYNWFIAYKPLVRSESGCFLTIVDDDDYMSLKEDGHDRAGLEDLFDIVAKLCPSLTKYVSIPYLNY